MSRGKFMQGSSTVLSPKLQEWLCTTLLPCNEQFQNYTVLYTVIARSCYRCFKFNFSIEFMKSKILPCYQLSDII